MCVYMCAFVKHSMRCMRKCVYMCFCVSINGHMGAYECMCVCTGVQVCVRARDSVVGDCVAVPLCTYACSCLFMCVYIACGCVKLMYAWVSV